MIAAKLDLSSPGAAAEIARSGRICYRSGFRASWRRAGPLANTDVANEHIRGLLIERRRSFEAVALLEGQKRPLCLRTCDAIERTVVEPYHVKLYLRPPDVVS